MKCNFIDIKVKNKNQNIFELFKLSIGNKDSSLYYNKNKEEYCNQNIKIIYYKKFMKKNIGKMKYEINENNKVINIFNSIFTFNNMKRAIIIINNKQYIFKKIKTKKKWLEVKIKFLDNIINLSSMFKDCELLSYVYNFHNFNTKNLKTVNDLFYKCKLLLNIDDISNWNISNVNNIEGLFYECSSLKELPDI